MKSGKERDIGKFMSLQDKLETSREPIRAGFGELQEIDMANTFYHLPHQLLASGFERLMKCYIVLWFTQEGTVNGLTQPS